MSPVSRRRKPKKTRARRRRSAARSDTCGRSTPPPAIINAVLLSVAGISDTNDPVQAELFACSVLADRTDSADFLADQLIPAVAERATPDAIGLVLALGAVADGPIAAAATAGLNRLEAIGAPAPPWADELRQPITSTGHRRIAFPLSTLAVLACEFHRAERTHSTVIVVHGADCDAAVSIIMAENATLHDFFDRVEPEWPAEAGSEYLDPAEFRRQVVHALDVRRDHELASGVDEADDDEGWPGHHALALLLRTWLESIPESDQPPSPHDMCARPPGWAAPLRRSKPLPAARTDADGPAPVFQLSVSLTGSTPPIWRRIEVPADITLDELHGVIQIAFEWDDYHPYAFATDYGVFGPPETALPLRSDESVTLEQVAPGENAKIRYVYDFEDCWEHEIVVEKVKERTAEDDVTLPRCTGGRCAAPPEESGGMQNYLDLLEILIDPGHPEHEVILDRFELDSADEFHPWWFEPAEVNWALGAAR